MNFQKHFSNIVTVCSKYRKENFLCDTLLLVGDKELRAHSIILAAASPFFQTIFQEYNKPEMHYIRLPGIEPDTMDIILNYIYTGKLLLPFLDKEEFELTQELFESFQLFGFDLEKIGNFVVDYKNENGEELGKDAVLMIESLEPDNNSKDDDTNSDNNSRNLNENEIIKDQNKENNIKFEKTDLEETQTNIITETPKFYNKESISMKKTHNCTKCEKSFSNKTYLEKHLKLHEDETKPTLCELCGLATMGVAEMHQHITSAHMKEIKSGKWYLCNICGKTFSKQSTLAFHMQKVHRKEIPNFVERQVFECEYCDKNYSSRTSIKLHVVMAHSDKKPYQCAQCNKGFAFKSQMISHTRMHTGERPFSCQTCGKAFAAMLNLVQHTRVHTGEKPFECSFCSKRFSQRSHLQTHIRTHTGEKPYVCHICSKAYKNRLDLRIHCLRIHQLNIKLREPSGGLKNANKSLNRTNTTT